ncbi:MAG: penicillin acylase family protein [Candidatus Thorarchaeota archaeon]
MALTSKKVGKFAIALALVISMSVILIIPLDIIPPLGGLIDPFTGIWTVYQNADHPPYASVHVPGLSEQVTVVRDNWGIPHIYAANEPDLYFAFGYVQAQDRLWQMDITRRQARGQLAEILGPNYISADRFLRTLGMERAAQLTIDNMYAQEDEENTTLVANMEAFVNGVNFFIANVGPNLPIEFKLLNYRPRPWTLIDSISVGRILDYGLSWSDTDLQFANTIAELGNDSAWELFPLNPPLQTPVVPEYGVTYIPPPSSDINTKSIPKSLQQSISDVLSWTENIPDPENILLRWQGDFIGSNNWAVNSTKSATGAPILCNDMHLSRDVPAIWYQAHLVAADTGRNIYGFVPPGVPLIIAGHTEYVAWGFTNVAADVIDWYYYNINPSNPNEYWYNGTWHTFEEETTIIQVKGEAPYYHTIRRSVHGPIMSDVGTNYNDYVIAQRWNGAEPSFEMIALNKMTMARNYTEFIEGQKFWWTISQNIVFADIYGNIAIRPTGHWPIRAEWYGGLPHNGSAGEGEWVDFVDFDELPLSLNPDRGWVVSANQLAAVQGPSAYPYYIHQGYAPGYRARRIIQMLESDDSITVDDMKRIQNDVLDTAAEALIPYLIDAFDSASPSITSDPVLSAAIDELRTWNFTMLKEWAAPTIWRAWYDYYNEFVFADEYPTNRGSLLWPSPVILENLTRFNPTSHWFNDTATSSTETRDDIILSSFIEAMEALTEEEGTDVSQWTWEKFHFVVYSHLVGDALGHEPIPADGSGVTVNPSRVNMWAREQGAAGGGPSERLIVNFDDVWHALSVIPGGESGHPLSRHYSDQLFQLFLVGDYHVDYIYFDIDDMLLLSFRVESILVLTG